MPSIYDNVKTLITAMYKKKEQTELRNNNKLHSFQGGLELSTPSFTNLPSKQLSHLSNDNFALPIVGQLLITMYVYI